MRCSRHKPSLPYPPPRMHSVTGRQCEERGSSRAKLRFPSHWRSVARRGRPHVHRGWQVSTAKNATNAILMKKTRLGIPQHLRCPGRYSSAQLNHFGSQLRPPWCVARGAGTSTCSVWWVEVYDRVFISLSRSMTLDPASSHRRVCMCPI